MIAALDPLALSVIETATLARGLQLGFTRVAFCGECYSILGIVATIPTPGTGKAVAECCGVRREAYAEWEPTS